MQGQHVEGKSVPEFGERVHVAPGSVTESEVLPDHNLGSAQRIAKDSASELLGSRLRLLVSERQDEHRIYAKFRNER